MANENEPKCFETEAGGSSAMVCYTDEMITIIDCPKERGLGANGSVFDPINIGAGYSGKGRCRIELHAKEDVIDKSVPNKSEFFLSLLQS